jgi:hypothetical protein
MLRYLLVACVLLWSSVASATTYYVDNNLGRSPTASDANSCAAAASTTGSPPIPTTPKRNIGQVNGSGGLSCLATGGGPHTLIIRGGVYDEYILSASTLGTTFPSGTSWNNLVRVANYNSTSLTGGCSPNAAHVALCGTAGESVIIRPSAATMSGHAAIIVWIIDASSYFEFDGIDVDGSLVSASAGISLSDNEQGSGPLTKPHHVRIKNAEVQADFCTNCGQGGSAINLGSHDVEGAQGGHQIQNVKGHGAGQYNAGGPTAGNYPIYIAAPNVLVEDSIFYNGWNFGIHVYNHGGDAADNVIIRRNEVYNIFKGVDPILRLNGIAIYGANGQIYDNVVWGLNESNVHSTSACLSTDDSGNKFYHNTCYDMPSMRTVYIGGGIASNPNDVRNNVGVQMGSGVGDFGSNTQIFNNIFTDPGFVSSGTGNFHLSAEPTNVPCLGLVLTDKDGVTRPTGAGCDPGAYEFIASGSLPSTPTNFSPVSGSTIQLFQTFTWTATNATAYDVYFGSADNLNSPLFSDGFVNPTFGANWTAGFIGWQNCSIVAGRIYPTAIGQGCVEQMVSTPLNAEQWVSVILPQTLGSAGGGVPAGLGAAWIGLRSGPPGNYTGYHADALGAGWANAPCYIGRQDPGNINTPIAFCTPGSFTWAAGDRLLFTASRSTLTAFRCTPSCVQIAQATDSTYPTGRANVGLYAEGSTFNASADDFWAGNLGLTFAQTVSAPSYSSGALNPSQLYRLEVVAKNAFGTADSVEQQYTATGAAAVAVGVRLRFKAP